MQNSDNVTIDDSVTVKDLKQSQDNNISLNNDNYYKDSYYLEGYIKLSDVKELVTKWKTKCTPERAKAARWEKANNLLVELQGILEKTTMLNNGITHHA